MKTIRLTTKRQATFPKDLCEDMALRPGDAVLVDSRTIDGERVWVLRPARDVDTSWFGCLRRYAGKKKRHDAASIRASIRKAMKRGQV